MLMMILTEDVTIITTAINVVGAIIVMIVIAAIHQIIVSTVKRL